MFKKLKDKIEEVKQSPLKITQIAQAVVSPTSSSVIEPVSNANFSIGEDCEDTPRSSPAKEGFQAVDLQDVPSPLPSGRRSRQSSISSVTSDASSLFPIYEMPAHSFNLQSDLESASEMDEGSSSQLAQVPKQELYHAYLKLQRRYQKYKGRSNDLLNYCRELDKDNRKLKNVLLECQEKSLRRISELKEQCALEQRAKAHLEEALRNDLEEKDHLIQTLHTKVKLLKESSSSGGSLGGENILIDFSQELNPSSLDIVHMSSDNPAQYASNQPVDNIATNSTRVSEHEELVKLINSDSDDSVSEDLQELEGGNLLEEVLSENSVNKSVNESASNGACQLFEENSSNDKLKSKEETSAEFTSFSFLEDMASPKDLTGADMVKGNFGLLKEFTNEIQTLKEKNAQYIKECDDLKLSLKKLEEDSKVQISGLTEKLLSSEKTRIKLTESNNELISNQRQLETQVQELSNELESTKEKNDAFIKERDELQLMLENVKTSSRVEIDTLRNKLLSFMKEADKTDVSNTEIPATLGHLIRNDEGTVFKLQPENIELKSSLKQLEDDVKGQVHNLQDKLRLCEKEKEDAMLHNIELSNSQSQLNDHIEDLRIRLQVLKEENNIHVRENDDLKSSLKILEDSIKEQVSKLQERLCLYGEGDMSVISNNELSSIQSQLNVQIDVLTSKLQVLKEKNDGYVKENNDLRSSLEGKDDDVKEQVYKLEEKLALSEQEKEKVILSNIELNSIHCQLNTEVENLSRELQVLKEENVSYVKESNNLKISVKKVEDDFKGEVSKLKEQICLFEEEKRKLLQSNSELSSMEIKLSSQIDDLTNKLKELKEENSCYIKENYELRDSVKKLEGSFNEEVDKLEKKLYLCEEEREKFAISNNELINIQSERNAQIDNITHQLQVLKEENAGYVKENNALRSSFEKLEIDCKEKICKVEEKFQLSEEEKKKCISSSNELSTIKNQLSAQIESLTCKLKSIEGENALYVQENTDLKSSLKKLEDDVAEQIGKLKENLCLCEEERKKVSLSNIELSNIQNQLNDQIADLTSTLKVVREENALYVSENNDLKSSLMKISDDVKGQLCELKEKLCLCEEEKNVVLSSNTELRTIKNELSAHIEDLTCQLEEMKEKNAVYITENSDLKSSVNDFKEQVDNLKRRHCLCEEEREKFALLNVELNNVQSQHKAEIEDLTRKLKLLREERSELQKVASEAKEHIDELKDKLKQSDQEKGNIVLSHSELSVTQNQLEARIQELSDELNTLMHENEILVSSNNELNADIHMLTANLKALKAENNTLISQVDKMKSSMQSADSSKLSQLEDVNEKLSDAVKEKEELTGKIQSLSTHIENLVDELECSKKENNSLLNKITVSEKDKACLESKLNSERTESNVNIAQLRTDIANLKEENVKLVTEMQNMKDQPKSEHLQEIKKLCAEKEILQRQFSDQMKTMSKTSQAYKADIKSLRRKIQHLVVDKILLEQELSEFLLIIEEKEKTIAERDEEHIQKIKQLAVNLGKQLAEKDEELQNVHTREFAEHVENEERHMIQQLRNQIRDIVEDCKKGNDAYELLMEDHKATEKAREADRFLLEQQIKDLQQSHEAEIGELNKKWRSYLKKELDVVQEKHKAEVAELSREWHWERKNSIHCEDEVPSEELENTSQLAVAAVESGTGSIELLHKQVVALTQELKEAKRKHRSEVADLNNLLLLRQKNSDGRVCTFHENCVEMEYIRNIMFQYMMGKEQMLLAKVIAAVMKFDPDQTDQILQKEVHKQTLLGHLGIL
ncbi:putative leucine-rich repeat-containing protein DDB_G0290503 [Anabrus simplex]|uniref:putative leucine-rich repeat-containing protein DDB_G0290503 n=1 Tax=Anabrus simplex TaxID=316456 RepID=UPI0035A2CC3C